MDLLAKCCLGLLLLMCLSALVGSLVAVVKQSQAATEQTTTPAVTGQATTPAVTGGATTPVVTGGATAATAATGSTAATAATAATTTRAATVTTPAATTAAPAPPVRTANYDLSGDNVSYSLADPLTCASLCTQHDDCSFYITDSAGKQCWLKKNPGTFTKNGDRIVYAPAAVKPPVTSFTALLGYDAPGADIQTNPWPLSKKQPDCNQACLDSAGCSYYVVDSANNRCWLKSGTQPGWQKHSGLDTYVPDGVAMPWTARTGYDNAGTDLAYSVTDPASCARQCAANNACQFYVTDSDGKQCWLKSGVGEDRPTGNRTTWTFPGQPLSPKLYIWVDANFSGQSAWFWPGSYGWLPVWNFPSDALSSLKVPPGFKVRLWDNKDFAGGKNIELAAGDYPNLKDQGFNDICSALQYYPA